MKHWGFPLATKVGCKLVALEERDIDLFIDAYRIFFTGYLEILKKRKDTPFTGEEERLKLERNGKWLEYLTLKDDAIKAAQATGIPPAVIIGLSYPPSAVF